MPNQAFQNSLRSKFSASLHSKDRDKFIASLREGATVEDKGYWEETASNIVPSGKKLISETWEMIKHPIQTAKSLYQLGSGVVQLAIPGEQENEDVARAAGQYFADRYGSLEKAKESLKNDPVGVVTEALGVVAGGTGLGKLAVKGAGKVSKVLPEIDTTAMASFPGIKFKDKNLKTAPMKTVDEMAELTASVKVTDDVISNQIKKFNKGKTLKSDKWTEPIYYHGTGADNLKNFSLSVPRYEGGVHGIYLSSDIFEASSYGKNLVTTRLKKDMKVWGGEELPYMGHRNVNKKTGRPDKGTVAKDFNGIKLGIYDDAINKNMLKEYRKIIEKVDNAVLERILDQLHVPGAKKKNIDTAVNLFKEKKQFTSELVGDDPTGVANVMKAGGYDAYLGRQNHIIIFNPKKNIKIEGMADNSNVAIHAGTHWGHTSKYKDVEKAAPIEEAIWSEINTGLQTADMVRLQRTKSNIIKEAYKNSLKSIINQGDLSSTELAGAIKKLRELGVPNLAKGGIPKAATGSIGLEEIKVTHTDGGGGGGRDFSGFRGSGKEYAMNYEPSRGGVEQGGTGSAEKQTEELLKEETPEVEEIVVTGSYDNTLDRINKLTTWYSEIGNSTNVNREQLAKAITDASEKNNVNADFLTTILAIETDLKEGKTSSTGAEGLSQIDPNMLKDINRIYKMNLKMEDLQDMNVAVDAQAKAINIVRMYARHYGHDHNNNEVIGQIYNIGIGDYNNGVRNPRYFGDRGKERADIMGVDIFSMPMTNDVPKLQEGGTPWGGATGTIYKEPSGPKPLQQQMINAFSEGGTLQNTELEETVVTGQRGKADYPGALNNPSSILNPNYQTWQNFQNIPTPMKDFARKPPEGFSEEAGTKTVVRGIDKSNELRNTSYDLRLDLAQRYNDDRFLDRTLVSSDEIIKLHKDFLAIAALQEGALPDLAKDLKTKQQLEDDTTLDYDEFKEYELAEAKYGNEFEETMKEVEDNKFEKKPAGIILKKIKEILNTDTDQISDKTIDKYNSFMTLLKTDYPELYEDETIVLYGPRTKRNLPYTKDDIPTTIYPTYEPPYNYGANLEKIDDFNKLPKGMTSLKNLDSEFKTKISMIKEVPNLIYELNNGLDSVIENNLINITT